MISFYPMLGPIRLPDGVRAGEVRLITAGEAPERPADPVWIAGLRSECAASGIPFYATNQLVGAAA